MTSSLAIWIAFLSVLVLFLLWSIISIRQFRHLNLQLHVSSLMLSYTSKDHQIYKYFIFHWRLVLLLQLGMHRAWHPLLWYELPFSQYKFSSYCVRLVFKKAISGSQFTVTCVLVTDVIIHLERLQDLELLFFIAMHLLFYARLFDIVHKWLVVILAYSM